MAVAGSGPLVLLVHGHPQFWWAWRAQIPALADAGYRVAALDLRGYGASDKPPGGHDLPTACDDLAAVVRSLGAPRAVVVGHGLGAWIAWSMPSLHPEATTAVAAVGMPHPRTLHRAMLRHPLQWRANDYLRELQSPFAPERQPMAVGRRLRTWSGPDTSWITDEVSGRYTEAMSFPFAGHAATEYHRWFYRCRVTPTGIRYLHRIKTPIPLPVLQVAGEHDPSTLPVLTDESTRLVAGPVTRVTVPGVGHFVPEEAPGPVSAALTGWLAEVSPTR